MTPVDRWLRCPYASVSMVRLELVWFDLGDTRIRLHLPFPSPASTNSTASLYMSWLVPASRHPASLLLVWTASSG